MYETSNFKIKIDFGKSHKSYIYDQNSKRYFLDFFGLYSSLPLGYNNPIFREQSFLDSYRKTASVKIANCEILSDEGEKFFRDFTKHSAMKAYKYFWFCCTGGLAVESAIKVAMDYKRVGNPVVVSLKESFHGISGYGSLVTDNFAPVNLRLEGLPTLNWPKVHNPKMIFRNGVVDEIATRKGLIKFEKEFQSVVRKYKGRVVALLIEPIQATFGDNHFPPEFFSLARKICDQQKIVLIFDEIQTGFGGTGEMWCWQHTKIKPDIVVFGKKSQVAGIMVRDGYGQIFAHPDKLSVTFDGDLADMIRCSQILKAYDRYHILENVRKRGEELKGALKQIKQLRNVRGQGLLIAFDFDSNFQQKEFARKAFARGLIFNRTRDVTIRLRPNLNVSKEEVNQAINIIKASVNF